MTGRNVRVSPADDRRQCVGEGDDRADVHRLLAAPDDRLAVEDDPLSGLLRGDASASGQTSGGLGDKAEELLFVPVSPPIERDREIGTDDGMHAQLVTWVRQPRSALSRGRLPGHGRHLGEQDGLMNVEHPEPEAAVVRCRRLAHPRQLRVPHMAGQRENRVLPSGLAQFRRDS